MSSVLRNAKYELFAQGIAKGMTRGDAYAAAGFTCKNPKNAASRISSNPAIIKRVEELQKASAARAEVSRAKILERIYDDWETARRLGQMAAALKAAEMMGREIHKMFTERKEIGGPGDFDNKSEEELRQILTDGLKDLGWDGISPKGEGKTIN